MTKISNYRTKYCATCGAPFTPRSGRQRYCDWCRMPKFRRVRNAEVQQRRRHPERYPTETPRLPGDVGYEPITEPVDAAWPTKAQRARWHAVRDYWVRCGADPVVAGQMAWTDQEWMLATGANGDTPYWGASSANGDTSRVRDLRKHRPECPNSGAGAVAAQWQPRDSWARRVVARAIAEGRQA